MQFDEKINEIMNHGGNKKGLKQMGQKGKSKSNSPKTYPRCVTMDWLAWSIGA